MPWEARRLQRGCVHGRRCLVDGVDGMVDGKEEGTVEGVEEVGIEGVGGGDDGGVRIFEEWEWRRWSISC